MRWMQLRTSLSNPSKHSGNQEEVSMHLNGELPTSGCSNTCPLGHSITIVTAVDLQHGGAVS